MHDLFEYAKTLAQDEIEEPISYLKNPIVTNKIKKGVRKLHPFTQEELNGFHLPNTESCSIITGKIEAIDSKALVIKEIRGEAIETITVSSQKSDTMQVGDRVTAVVDNTNRVLLLKYGPIFGDVSFKLFFKNNKKSCTEFIVSR